MMGAAPVVGRLHRWRRWQLVVSVTTLRHQEVAAVVRTSRSSDRFCRAVTIGMAMWIASRLLYRKDMARDEADEYRRSPYPYHI